MVATRKISKDDGRPLHCDSEGEITIDDNYTPEDLREKGVI